MAVKTPLVMGDLYIEQLQAGDTIATGASVVNLTADATFLAGQAAYASAADHCNLAEANASGTVRVIGLAAAAISSSAAGAIQYDGIVVLTTTQWDAMAGTTGGLTFNTQYYLDPATPGNITSTMPTTVGQYVVPIGVAISTTELLLNFQQPILL